MTDQSQVKRTPSVATRFVNVSSFALQVPPPRRPPATPRTPWEERGDRAPRQSGHHASEAFTHAAWFLRRDNAKKQVTSL